MIAETKELICRKCGMARTAKSFRFRDRERGTKHSECNSCHNNDCKVRRKRQRGTLTASYLRRLRALGGDPTMTEALVTIMSKRYGGAERVAHAFHTAIELGTPRLKFDAALALCALAKSFDAIQEERQSYFVEFSQSELEDIAQGGT